MPDADRPFENNTNCLTCDSLVSCVCTICRYWFCWNHVCNHGCKQES